MATIRQVAEKAGVSISTVSLVLNKQFEFSSETASQVLKAAEELNYTKRRVGRPNRAPNSKATTRRKNQIGLVIGWTPDKFHSNAAYMDVLRGVEQVVTEHGHNLVLRYSPPDTLSATSSSSLISKTDGIILLASAPEYYRFLGEMIPCVRCMGLPEKNYPWDHVTYDNDVIGGLAADYILKRGHRNCAYLSPRLSLQTMNVSGQTIPMHEPLEGARGQKFIQVIESAGGTVRINQNTDEWLSDAPERMRNILADLLLTKPRPTALFVPFDYLVSLTYNMLPSLGLRPHIDIEIVSCNNENPILMFLHPRPAVVDIHAARIGVVAARQLLARLEEPDMPRTEISLTPSLAPGEPVNESLADKTNKT